jgi:hypothetical protein
MKNPFKFPLFKRRHKNNNEEPETTDENNQAKPNGWIGVDLDGTLAEYNEWESIYQVGAPVPRMVDRVKKWLEEGFEVRIFTARVGPGQSPFAIMTARIVIRNWCLRHLGRALPVTATKDFGMIELWDDRAIHVVPNTGLTTDKSSVDTTQ